MKGEWKKMEGKTYGYLGPQGTFSEMSALKYSNSYDKIIPYKTIKEVMEKVDQKKIERGIIPLENSQEGSVNLSLDLMLDKNFLEIIGEVIIPIEHFLLASPGTKMEDIEEIYSHPQAIAQSRDFIDENLHDVEINYTNSTASAADIILDEKNKAMIGSQRINQLYDLEILAKNVEGQLENHTRFVVIAHQENNVQLNSDLPNRMFKTSIVCTPVVNQPGVLYDILGEFANRKIDLTRIESRPTKKRLGEYLFYIDLEGKRSNVKVANSLKKVKEMSRLFKILGSYPRDNKIERSREENFTAS